MNFRAGYDHNTGWDNQIGCIPIDTTITIDCVNDGLVVSGPYGSETIWDRTTYNGQTGYVSDAWVYTGTNGAVAATCAPTPPPTQPSPPAFDRVAKTDQLLFQSSMATFLAVRATNFGGSQPTMAPTGATTASPTSSLDWSTDACSVPKVSEPVRSQPRGYDFRAPCWRHDFGYRNYKSQGRFTEPSRQQIDDNFHQDMYNVCVQYTGLRAARGVECRRIADIYYGSVRACGSNNPACSKAYWTPALLQIFA